MLARKKKKKKKKQEKACISFKSIIKPVKTGGLWGIFAKVDLLPIDNDSEKKKGAKKHKSYQIPRKLLLTLLLPM